MESDGKLFNNHCSVGQTKNPRLIERVSTKMIYTLVVTNIAIENMAHVVR